MIIPSFTAAVALFAVTAAAASLEPAGANGSTRALTAACPEGQVSEDGFSDVAETGIHEDAIDCAVWWQVASGATVERYAPASRTSRAQMASFLTRLLARSGEEVAAATSDHFTDDDGSVHEASIDALAETGLLSGTSPGRFSPRAPVTRGQMASFLVATYEHRTARTLPRGPDRFTDDDGTTHEAAIDTAAEAGFATGYGDGQFRPGRPVTRAEIASFLDRVLDRLVSEGDATPPAPDPVLLAVGDTGVCNYDRDEATAALAAERRGTITVLGDLAYEKGSASDYERCWRPAWGALASRVRPVPGNHDYQTPGATPYFDEFGPAAGERGKGWYSFEAGAWHVIALNSNCGIVGCSHASEQAKWLRADLQAAGDRPVMAYWHHARFSSGRHGSDARVDALWRILDEHGASLVVQGHEHDYERLDPVDPSGAVSPDGIRSFVVGTGGAYLRSFQRGPLVATAARSADAHGLLVLTLGSDHYSWEFVPVAGRTFTDRGRAAIR